MIIYLYRVGRNLNRAYRTCEAFGVTDLCLIECDGKIEGNLFKAKGNVNIQEVSDFPTSWGLLALETTYQTPIWEIPFWAVQSILIGGETGGLPCRIEAEYQACIPMVGRVSGLTVEAALAITLYEERRQRGVSDHL